jgi:hypothetical protein
MNRHERQSFLGPRSEEVIQSIRAAIVGVNGGGSHLVQQLSHVGIRRYAFFDPGLLDTESNLTRNVISTRNDFEAEAPKVVLAQRKVESVLGKEVEVEARQCRWQERPESLATCDIIFGGVDTFRERAELEAFARRYMIPYLDIGLDVNTVDGQPPRMAGQIILSMPGYPCMRCLHFLTDERLALEAAKYGDVGGRPQVVWSNGALASTAVGVAMDLFCDWTKQLRDVVYLSYDGNTGYIGPHPMLPLLDLTCCSHYPLNEVGPVRYVRVLRAG